MEVKKMSEYVDVAIIENGKQIGSFKAERITKKKAEKKDEIKNKISMALKDPILQQGFECICKENADLRTIRDARAKCMSEDKDKLEIARTLLKQWLQTTHAGGCDNVNLGTETEQFLAEA